MYSNYDYIKENLKQIVSDIEETKAKYRKESDIIDIMAVTKTVPAEIVNIAVENGVKFLGENRVQEYISKKDNYLKEAEVHFIGYLQTNKIKYILNEVTMIQSVDRIELAKEINRQCIKQGIKKDVLIEINIGNEISKSGFSEDNLNESLYEIKEMSNISVKGLMTIPPKEDIEKYFLKMNQLFIDIKEKNIDNINMSILSMGMSSDYKLAVKYGSNLVRIGTKLFGARK